jgi:hypothetical protein
MRRLVPLVVVLAVLAPLARPASAAETARQILDRRKALDDGPRHWTDRTEKIAMTIVAAHGGERTRGLTRWERRDPGDVTRTLVFFDAPAEVKGTGFLSVTRPGTPADQWLWLPELKRVRQIAARARNESFVGSDFTYHDLDVIQHIGDWTEDEAHSSLQREEAVDGVACWVIGLAPQASDEAYKKIVVWLGKDDLVPRRLAFYEDPGAGDPTRRIVQRDVRNVGAIPVPHTVEVETPAKGSHTTIVSSDVAFDQHLPDDLFTEAQLERGAP